MSRVEKTFSFASWATDHPSDPVPGDRIDIQFDNHRQAIQSLTRAMDRLVRADGKLNHDLLTPESLPRDLLEGLASKTRREVEDFVDPLIAATKNHLRELEQTQLGLQATLAEIKTRQREADRLLRDTETLSGSVHQHARQAMSAVTKAANLQAQVIEDQNWKDLQANTAQDWALVSTVWAEFMDGAATIPPNILASNSLTGDHWSSRWWAHRAAGAAGMLAWWYQGAFPGAPPSTPNTPTGQPIPIGGMYFDTISGKMFVWNGSSWVPLAQGPAAATTSSLYYLATAGQTVFNLATADHFGASFSFNQTKPEGLHAFVNGVRVVPTDDYSINVASSTVTFVRPLSANAIAGFDILTPVSQLTPSGSVNTVLVNAITPDGVKTHFAGLTAAASGAPVSAAKSEELLVSVNGVQQSPGASYSATADSIDFVQAPEADANVFIVWFGPSLGAGSGAGPPPPSAPAILASPVVTGAATAGSALNTTDGVWSNSPTLITYQWRRNGANIAGAAAPAYTLVSADSSTTVTCLVIASNAGGSASAVSNAISVLPTAPVNSVPPSISGTASIGSTLTLAGNGTWSGGPTFATQWLRDNSNIPGATASTYAVVSADAGHAISAAVTATNAAGSASAGSNALAIPLFPGSPVGIFSVRKVGTGYAGPCLKVRRTSDSVQQDIGFNPATGFIDMSAAAAFAGSALLYVTKWYDQSGGGLDVAQASPGAEPLLVSINGRPYLSFQGGVGSILASAAVGAFALTADHTIGAVTQLNSDLGQVPIGCTDGGAGWAFFYNGVASGPGPQPGKNVFWTPGGAVTGTFDMFGKMPTRMVTTRASTALKIYANGTLGGSGTITTVTASTEVLKIGSYAHFGLNYEGLIGEVFVYASALTDPVRLGIDANQALAFPDTTFATPYNGAACVQFGLNEQISFGNILNYERTQPWTAWGAIQMYGVSPPAIAGGIVFSNVTAPSDPAFPGYEMWVDKQGFMRVRVINNAATFNMIGMIGAVFLADGKKHMLCATYDGSSLAAGIKLYVDGVQDTGAFSEGSFLTASIIKAGQAMYVGTQQNEGAFNFTGTIGHVQLDNVVRSAAYIAPVKNGVIPPKDANTVWRLLLNEGTGVTVNDTSGGGRNGTLTSGNMWVP